MAIGIATSGAGIGQLAISPLLQLSIEHFGLAKALIILGASISLCFCPVFFIYQSSSGNEPKSKVEKSKSMMKIYKEIFSTSEIVLLLIYLGE